MNSVLVISNDSAHRAPLKEVLAENGFLVHETPNVEWLPEILKRHSPDLVLLDVRSVDQRDLARIMVVRDQTDVPILVLCGDSKPMWRAEAFNCGADGFVNRPIFTEEFLARINANIRRDRLRTGHSKNTEPESHPAAFGRWLIDDAQSQIFDDDGHSGGLTANEYKLLITLLKNAGTVMNRKSLCEAMQEESYVPQPRAIDIKIARIRKKICDDSDNPKFIKTVRGIGYMFNKFAVSDPTGTAPAELETNASTG